MQATAKRTFVTETHVPMHRFWAEVVLDYTQGPGVPTTWLITLKDRSTELRVARLELVGPFTTESETTFVAWLRARHKECGIDDGDLFAMRVRHDIYTLIGMCYVQQPDITP